MTPREFDDRCSARLSRRQALRLLWGAGAVAILVGCGGEGPVSTATTAPAIPSPTTAPATTAAQSGPGTAAAGLATATATARAAGTPAASPAAAVRTIRVPDTGAKLPTQNVTFRYLNSGDFKAVFFKEYFAAYQRARPNITVQYDGLPLNEINRLVPLGVQSSNAPDCFQIPGNVTTGQMVREGWVRPLDDVVPNFAAWKRVFPPGVLVEGLTVFGGKTYALPYVSTKQYATLLFYNEELLQQAGYDPGAKPLGWDEFRAAARKVTEQGRGQYFGIIEGGNQVNRWADMITNLAQLAGADGGQFNHKTGQYTYTSDPFLAAIDLLLGLKADGSYFPGSLQIDAPQARARFPQGAAAMILQGTWNIPQWQQEAPAFKFGVSSVPLPNGGRPGALSYGPGASIPMFIYAKSRYPEIAGDMFAYLGGVEGQTAFATATNGSDRPMLPQAIAAAELDPRVRKAYGLFDEQLRLAPSPVVRNPEIEAVNLELRSVTPNLGQMLQGLFSGQIRDPKAAMQDLQDRSERELDRAVKAAADKGAKVSRDDYVFPNWDPMRDYTDADYTQVRR